MLRVAFRLRRGCVGHVVGQVGVEARSAERHQPGVSALGSEMAMRSL